MSTKLLQYNSGDHILGNKNIVETVVTEGDIVFNESYIVVGTSFEARKIHATYDLSVFSNIIAESISVNGDLFVKGDIEADELICRGIFICTGEVRVKKINLESYSSVDSIVSKELYSNGDLFIRTTVDTDSFLEADGLVVAGEGIMGAGFFKARAAIANEYFEFLGKNTCKVFEISEIDFSLTEKVSENSIENDDKDIFKIVEEFNKTFSRSLDEWSQLEEDDFLSEVRRITKSLDDLHFVDRVIDKIIELSYEREITNFNDFLYVLWAKNIFPGGIAKYETIAPVLNDMYDDAKTKVEDMKFNVSSICEFAYSLYILDTYQTQLPISIKDGADKIFSSIGLRFSTVQQVWGEHNG